jgi:uncharacterized protein YggE
VVAEASVAANPDHFVLLAALNAMAESAADALAKVAELVEAATGILTDRGIADAALRTQTCCFAIGSINPNSV